MHALMRSGETPEATVASFVAALGYEDVPDDLVRQIERAYLDTVGVTLAGSVEGAGQRAIEFASRTAVSPDGEGVAIPVGDETFAVPEAALVMGTAGHTHDYDDVSWGMDGHPSVTVVPSVFALAEETGASGRDAIAAYAAAYETMCYVGAMILPEHYESGWHATSTLGVFGATAASGWVLDLDEDDMLRALNVAASMPAGLKRNAGTMTKPLHAGLAARSGVTAALLAAEGFTANDTAITGHQGFVDLYDGVETDVVPDPADGWYMRESGLHVKCYPSCYFTHVGIAAAEDLRDGHGIEPDQVERVDVEASRGATDTLVYGNPTTQAEAKFSMHYTVASALLHDRVGFDSFEEETITDPEIQSLCDRVSFGTDSSLKYDTSEARVRIETTDGQTYETSMTHPPGSPQNPISEERMREKFFDCAGRAVSDSTAERVYDRLSSLREAPSVGEILQGLR